MTARDDETHRAPGATRLGENDVSALEAPADVAASVSAAEAKHARGEGPEFYQVLVESVRDYAIFALDPYGYVRTWNAGAERLKGYTSDEIIGRHFSVFHPPEDVAAGKPQWELEVAASEGRIEDEGWRVRKDGSRFWANVIITSLRDAHGMLIGFAKVTQDLTAHRQADETLRQSEERFRQLVEHVRDYAIFMLDTEGRVASWNEGAEAIKGWRVEEIIGHHFSLFYSAADVAAGKPKRVLKIAAREGRFEEEAWRVRKDGTSFWASVVVTALRNDDGELIGFTKITRDLTERRAAHERALADARRVAEAEAANRAKSEFLRAMSHELRTPINATMGYAQLIEAGIAGPITDLQHEYLSRLQASQQHLLRIITDMLNYSRIEAGHIVYNIGPVPVHTIVEAVLPMIEMQARTKGLALEYDECAMEITASADRARAEQIVLNLLSNAVKFTPAGGRVTVECASNDESAVITVRDTGPGIPAGQFEAIFEPFVQVGRSLTSAHEGTGLGLAISRDLARAMSGDIVVESTPGKGAVFTLRLPRGMSSEL